MISRAVNHILAFLVAYSFILHVFDRDSVLSVAAFVPSTRYNRATLYRPVSQLTNPEQSGVLEENDDNEEEEDFDFLFDEPPVELDATERVWRYAKKPLLRIGSKGATHAHGNSLRQLLEDHIVVKVKVNTKKFNNSVQQAYETLRNLAVENGAPADIELIQLREGSKEILFALPGTIKRMEEGSFPPPVPVASNDDEDLSLAD